MLVVLLVFCSICVSVPVQSSQAKTWTKAATQKEIKKTKSQIKKYEALNKKNKKGTIAIGGKVISFDPFIVEDIELFGTSYYWVENPQKMNTLLTLSSGNVKKTGKYRKYNNYTCAVVKAVKIKTYDNQISKLKSKLDVYEKALQQYAIVNAPDMPQYIYLQKGQKYNAAIEGYYSDCKKYCKYIVSSSNKSVATVNSKGLITAVGTGTAKITVKMLPSGKKTVFKVVCGTEPPIQLEATEYTYTKDKPYVTIKYKVKDGWDLRSWEITGYDNYYEPNEDYEEDDGFELIMFNDAPETIKVNVEFTDDYITVSVPCTIRRIDSSDSNSDSQKQDDLTNGDTNNQYNNDDYYDNDDYDYSDDEW